MNLEPEPNTLERVRRFVVCESKSAFKLYWRPLFMLGGLLVPVLSNAAPVQKRKSQIGQRKRDFPTGRTYPTGPRRALGREYRGEGSYSTNRNARLIAFAAAWMAITSTAFMWTSFRSAQLEIDTEYLERIVQIQSENEELKFALLTPPKDSSQREQYFRDLEAKYHKVKEQAELLRMQYKGKEGSDAAFVSLINDMSRSERLLHQLRELN